MPRFQLGGASFRSPVRASGTIFHPGLSVSVHPSPVTVLPTLTAGAATTSALQSGFMSAPFFPSITPHSSEM